MRQVIYLTILTLMVLLAACNKESQTFNEYSDLIDSTKPLSLGEDNEVHIFLGIPNMDSTAAVLERSITRTVRLVVDEPYFEIAKSEAEQIIEFTKYKNLVLCGTLDSPDEVSSYIRKSLTTDFKTRVEQQGAELFIAYNSQSRDQVVLYLVAKDKPRLANLANQRADQIFRYLLERYLKRLGNRVYSDKVLPAVQFKDLPFTMQIPRFYQVYKENKTQGFSSYIFKPNDTGKPVKLISVYHESMLVNKADTTWLYNTRQELGKVYFEGDKIISGRYVFEPDTLAGNIGWRIQGQWGNETLNGGTGGAFQSFAFWHEQSKTAWLIDNIVINTQGDKLKDLLQLGIISHSLEIK